MNKEIDDQMLKDDRAIELFVPGRLCLFGEHSDWAGRFKDINSDIPAGQAIVTGIDLGLYAAVRTSDIFELITMDETGKEVRFSCEMNKDTLEQEAAKPVFWCYACGVAAYVMENYHVGGVRIHISKSTLPIKKGLSSSAAICVLVARAFNELYQLRISVKGEMQVAFRGELLTSSRCGRLDQACAYGVRPVCMEFDGERVNVEKLNVGRELYWVFADLSSGKDTKRILSDLNSCYPFARNELERNVQEALGADNHQMIAKAKKAISDGDAERIGRLMTEAQRLFDEKVAPACPAELKSPVLHKTLGDPIVQQLSYGGKGVGSQGDGTVQFIAKDKRSSKELADYLSNTLGMPAFEFTLPAHNRVRKAIIPMAGFATRMYPASRFIKKSFFPVRGEDGFFRPIIMYLLEELDREGIEEIILVVAEGEEQELKNLFDRSLSPEAVKKLPKQLQNYERTIGHIAGKLRFAVQKERMGFGHAVAQARPFLSGEEPALLLLGDYIYKSNRSLSCTRQTINAYTKSGGQTVVSIQEVDLQKVMYYGCVTGEFDRQRQYLMHVSGMKEKPGVDYAREYLAVNREGRDCYYATFGQYVLTPRVFDYLEEEIALYRKENRTGEIDLTGALQRMCTENGMTAVLVDGTSYDVGMPDAYMDTCINFPQKQEQ